MTSTGFTAPGTVADDATVGTVAWTNVNNAKAQDGTNSTTGNLPGATTTSHYLKLTNFGFVIPAGAAINGVTVRVRRQKVSAIAGNVKDSTVSLVLAGTVSGSNKATATNWPTSLTDEDHGASNDLWGLSLADTDINNSGFGVVVSCVTVAAASVVAGIDIVSISVDYTARPAIICRPTASRSFRRGF